MIKIIFSPFIILFLISLFSFVPNAYGSSSKNIQKIIFIPQDNRPISSKQTAQIIEDDNFYIVMPKSDILGSRYSDGNPEEIMAFIEQNASPDAILVASSDALIYGSLVASRKHSLGDDILLQRLDRIKRLKSKYPKMKMYIFSSIMRTPKENGASITEDDKDYKKYYLSILNFSKLDGIDTSNLYKPYLLTLRDETENQFVKNWLSRRKKNHNVNQILLNYTKEGIFDFLLIGKDDHFENTPTYKEGEELKGIAKTLGLNYTKTKIIDGIDELAAILLTKIKNEKHNISPKIYVEYALGFGPATVPTYSSDAIDSTISDEIYALSSKRVFDQNKADFVFLINTTQSGHTYDANTPVNTTNPHFNSEDFLGKIKSYLSKNKKVVVADIAFANGSDNALMDMLFKESLLDKINGYAGWNTATNSTGFALAFGVNSLSMKEDKIKNLLAIRYLDDWLYQGNLRQELASYLPLMNGEGDYLKIGSKLEALTAFGNRRLNRLKNTYLKNFKNVYNLELSLPWDRIFEIDLINKWQDFKFYKY